MTLAPKVVQAFLKNRPKKLFSNYLADGLLIVIRIDLTIFLSQFADVIRMPMSSVLFLILLDTTFL